MTDNQDAAQLPVIFILSPGHSGSTLLDLLVGTHSAVVSGGEFYITTELLESSCTCGAPRIYDCPLWSQVNDKLHADGFDLGDIAAYEGNADDFTALNAALFNAMLDGSEADIVLDSSKRRKKRLKHYLRNRDRFDLRLILLTRDPLRTVASYKNKGASVFSTCMRLNRVHCRQIYYAFLTRSFVRYEALVRRPEGELARIMRDLGLDMQEQQLSPSLDNAHNLGGNRMRQKPLEKITIDDSWKTRLSTGEKILTFILTLPARLFIRTAQGIYTLRCYGLTKYNNTGPLKRTV